MLSIILVTNNFRSRHDRGHGPIQKYGDGGNSLHRESQEI